VLLREYNNYPDTQWPVARPIPTNGVNILNNMILVGFVVCPPSLPPRHSKSKARTISSTCLDHFLGTCLSGGLMITFSCNYKHRCILLRIETSRQYRCGTCAQSINPVSVTCRSLLLTLYPMTNISRDFARLIRSWKEASTFLLTNFRMGSMYLCYDNIHHE
jgi:hypothetical protein